jgi:ABC-type antimicrobial peptide transport system permease subunit
MEPISKEIIKAQINNPSAYVVPRNYYTKNVGSGLAQIDIRYNDKKTYALGILGMDKNEILVSKIDEILTKGRWINNNRDIIISSDVAKRLEINLKKETYVNIWGIKFKVCGIFDNKKFDSFFDLDNQQFTPINQTASAGWARSQAITTLSEERQVAAGHQALLKEQDYSHIPSKNVIIISHKLLHQLGGKLRSVAIGLSSEKIKRRYVAKIDFQDKTLFSGLLENNVIKRDKDNDKLFYFDSAIKNEGFLKERLKKISVSKQGAVLNIWRRAPNEIENLLDKLSTTLFIGEDNTVTAYSSLKLSSLEGLSGLFVPILIAALIVLNTMLGSVYERFKEIGTYSSVGLAPMHIASLFIAESAVYAVIGGVAGYLIGQVAAKVLTSSLFINILAKCNIEDLGMSLNYSSLSTTFSTMLVMGIVVISALYPAKLAANMAVPGVERKWKFPEPKGDIWNFNFPFSISSHHVIGLCAFLKEYFSSYEEESIGTFYTDGVKMDKVKIDDREGYLLNMNIWLAPFHLGVSQKTEIKAIPEEGYDNHIIKMNIIRKSGDIGSWKRVNAGFLKVLRKEFLIWRTISDDMRAKYIEEGGKILNG